MSFRDHPNKHIAHEVLQWVTNWEDRFGKESVAKENEGRFLYETWFTHVVKGTESDPIQVLRTGAEQHVEKHFELDWEWEGRGNQRLEDMFGDFARNTHYEDEQAFGCYEHITYLPETLHVLFHRIRLGVELDDEGYRKTVLVTRPIDVPSKIDFGKGGFRKALYPWVSQLAEACAKKYKLAGVVVGRLDPLLGPPGPRDGNNPRFITRFGYVYNPTEGQWYEVTNASGGKPVTPQEVHACCNGLQASVGPTNTFPLRLYYQVESDRETVDATRTLTNYALAIRARLELKRLKREAWEREDAEREVGRAFARAALREEQRQADEARARVDRAARDAASEQWRREHHAKLAEEKRIFEERAVEAKAAHEAREAERIAKAREARAEHARKQAEAEEAKKAEGELAKEAAREKAAADRVARAAAKAEEKLKKKAGKGKNWVNPIAAEEAARKKYSDDVAEQEREAKQAAAAKEAAEREAAAKERERKATVQAEEATKIAEAVAHAQVNKESKRESKRESKKAAKLGQNPPLPSMASASSSSSSYEATPPAPPSPLRLNDPPPPELVVHNWVHAACKVQDTMREVAEAALTLREAEDTAKAIKASLESAGMPPAPEPAPEPEPEPEQWASKAPTKGTRNLQGQRVCRYFGRGKCRNGDACRYVHTDPEPAPAPAPEPAPAPDPESNSQCVICFDGVKDHLCMPCKHLCVCAACADVVERFKACPMCREPIVDIFKVFA